MADDSRTDEELVAAANAGETAAFEALYRRYRDWAVRLAIRFTHDHDDALEVMQEVFLHLLRKFPGFVLTARLTTYLYPVIRNLSLTRHRKRRPTPIATEELAIMSASGEVESANDRAELDIVLKALPEVQREVLLMRYVDAMSIAEIGSALRIPSGTVKSRLHHALAKLREDPRTRRYFEP